MAVLREEGMCVMDYELRAIHWRRIGGFFRVGGRLGLRYGQRQPSFRKWRIVGAAKQLPMVGLPAGYSNWKIAHKLLTR